MRFSAIAPVLAGVLLTLPLLTGCGDDGCDASICDEGLDSSAPDTGVDGGLPDAESDAGPEDSGILIDFGPRPDAGFFDAGQPINEGSCTGAVLVDESAVCRPSCPGSSACLSSPAERFCADDCGGRFDECLDGYSCIDVRPSNPLYFCLPPGFSCLIPGASMGTRCAGDTGACQGDREACQGDLWGYGYCTDRCPEDSCPPGYTCGSGDDGEPTCLSQLAPPAERCGTEGRPDESPCLFDGDCVGAESGPLCVGVSHSFPGVCASACASGAECSEGQLCRTFSSGRSACIPERCACRGEHAEAGRRDLLGEALEAVGLDRCSAVLDPAGWAVTSPDVLADPYRLEFTNPVVSEPWRAPSFAGDLVNELETAAEASLVRGTARMVESLAARLDRPARSIEAPTMPDATEPLAEATIAFIQSLNGLPNEAEIRADANDVPMDLQWALATVIDGMRRAAEARRVAFDMLAPNAINQLYRFGHGYIAASVSGSAPDPTSPSVQQIFNEDIDYGALYGGAAALLDAIADADLERFAEQDNAVASTDTTIAFNQETPIGRIVLGGGESGIWDGFNPELSGEIALLVDLGGNDEYNVIAGANRSSLNFVSVSIDLSGSDDYGYIEVPSPSDGNRLPSDGLGRATDRFENVTAFSLSTTSRQGAGRTGIGLMLDFGNGDDEYRALRLSQGAGIFGVGALIDAGGSDRYLGEAVVQGAGMFGMGLMVDGSGDDVRSAYQAAQAFGFVRGAGLVFDGGGSDEYELDVGSSEYGGDLLYPSAQTSAWNNSLGQGFAFGRRGDLGASPDRAFMSGGLAVLLDEAGDDAYRAGVFAQGTGFWWGTGILADREGNDTYDGVWYAMGTGAHFATGVLLDGAGDDIYGGAFPGINVTIGGGHDFSAAVLVDQAGNDEYHGSRITLGCGNSNGRGFFVDHGGQDDYRARSRYSMGSAGLLDPNENFLGSSRRRVPTVGVFIDAAGSDLYAQTATPTPGIMNDAAWLQTNAATVAITQRELGTGVDGDGDGTLHTPWR